MTPYRPGHNRPWYKRKTRLGLLGAPAHIEVMTRWFGDGNWFELIPIKLDSTTGRLSVGLLDPLLESLDSMVLEPTLDPDQANAILNRVQKRRQELGLPGAWPVFQESPDANKGPWHGRSPVGFGGINLVRGSLDPGTVFQAGFDYYKSRKSSFSQAFRTSLIGALVLGFLLWWTISLLAFGPDKLTERLNQLRSLDHPRFEMRLNQSQARLARFTDLCGEIRGTRGYEALEPETRSWVEQRQIEAEDYLAWIVPLKGVSEAKNGFRIGDLEQSLVRGNELKRKARSIWRELDSYQLLQRLCAENDQLIEKARGRLRSLDSLRREALDLGGFVLEAKPDFSGWAAKADLFLQKLTGDTPGESDHLLEIVEARASLDRAASVLRTERRWLTFLGLASPSGWEKAGAFGQWRANWFDPKTAQSDLPDPVGAGGSNGDSPVGALPSEFREKVANAAKLESLAWLNLGAGELEKIWPGRDPSQGIPKNIATTLNESQRWRGLREWVSALNQLQTPPERPVPPLAELDPWVEVEQLVKSYPPAGTIRRVIIEGPLAEKDDFEGKIIRLDWRQDDLVTPLTASISEELRGLGVIRITFEAPVPINWVGNRPMAAILTAEKARISWDGPTGPPWAGWNPLLGPGKREPKAPDTPSQGWKLRTVPPLPGLPGLLGK